MNTPISQEKAFAQGSNSRLVQSNSFTWPTYIVLLG